MSMFSEGLEEDIWKLTKENEILKSKASQFESTIKATIAEKEKLIEQNEIMRDFIEKCAGGWYNNFPIGLKSDAADVLNAGNTEPTTKLEEK